MSRFNREKFFAQYRQLFGPLTQAQVDGINFVLGRIEQDARLNTLDLCAYVLATVQHETARTFQPIKEYGSDDYFVARYWTNKRVRDALGNKTTQDAITFCGKGYVQLTGRSNYAMVKRLLGFDCVKDPSLIMQPPNAYEVLVRGMMEGWFGRSLREYIKPGAPPNFEGARHSVNGTDRATHIADDARRFLEILRSAA